MASQYNPIQKVDNNSNIPCPSGYVWSVNDVSDKNAGRTEDALMHKMRIARKRKLELEWQNVSTATANAILTAFEPQYVNVKCLDPLANGFVTKKFYSGDQKSEAYNTRLGLWTVSFDIIEQ